LRYHPAVIAQAAATVACLAPQRAFLAIGTGEALNEYSATGEWPSHDNRRARTIEAIEIIRALWTGDKVIHRGTHYQLRDAKLYTRPELPIPLYVSALTPNSARMAGRYGDGIVSTGGRNPMCIARS